MANMTIELYNLTVYINNMSDVLCSYSNWNDDVSKSYERFVDSVRSIVSSLDFTLNQIEGAIRNLDAMDTNKQESELSGYRAQLGSL